MLIGIDARMWGPGFGGLSRYLRELTSALWRLDSENNYVVFLIEPEFSRFRPSSNRIKKIKVSSPHYGFREQFLLPRELGKEKTDLLHFPNFNVPVFYPGRFIVTIHDLTPLEFPGPGRDNFFFKKATRLVFSRSLRRASEIIAVSQDTKKKILGNFSILPEKIRVIYEGAGLAGATGGALNIEAAKRKNGIIKPYILYSGSWRIHKNLSGLVRAFAILVREKGADLELVLGGWGDQRTRDDVLKTAAAEGVKDRLKILTPAVLEDEEIFSLMGGASVVAVPSFAEGFGFLGLEALRSGGFAAVSDIDSLREILGEAALFFNPRDPRDMADKMARIISDASICENLRALSRPVLQKYDWNKTARETLEIYKKAVLGE